MTSPSAIVASAGTGSSAVVGWLLPARFFW
jgi:hypothetical protein